MRAPTASETTYALFHPSCDLDALCCVAWTTSPWFALPLIEAAGSKAIGDDVFNEIFHPIAERVLARCDACLRAGGPSQGADRMVEVARSLGKPVVDDSAEIPSHAVA